MLRYSTESEASMHVGRCSICMNAVNELTWTVLSLGAVVSSIGMLHVIAGSIKSTKELHILRVRVQELRLERVSRLRKLRTEEDGGFEIVEDEAGSVMNKAA